MARHDGDLRVKGGQPLDAEELLALLDSAAPERRPGARACYFAAGEGWREAERQLGGAFASELGPMIAEDEE